MRVETRPYRVASRLDLHSSPPPTNQTDIKDLISVGSRAKAQHGPSGELQSLAFGGGPIVNVSAHTALEKWAGFTASSASAAGMYVAGEYVAKTPQNEISAFLSGGKQLSLPVQTAEKVAAWLKEMMKNPAGQYIFVFCAGGVFGAGVVYAIKPQITLRQLSWWFLAIGISCVTIIAIARYFEVLGPTKVVN
jgi:hypothetical protein